MSSKKATGRTVSADRTVRQGRLVKAKQFLQVAEDAGDLSDGDDVVDACVTLDVHAGIAAADAICAGALLEMKTRAGYGHDPISGRKLARAKGAAQSLVQRAPGIDGDLCALPWGFLLRGYAFTHLSRHVLW